MKTALFYGGLVLAALGLSWPALAQDGGACQDDDQCPGPAHVCQKGRCVVDPLAEERLMRMLLGAVDRSVVQPCQALPVFNKALDLAKDAGLRARVSMIEGRIDITQEACTTGGFGVLSSSRKSKDGASMVLVPGGYFRRGSDRMSLQSGLKVCRETYSHPDDCTTDWFQRESPRRDIELSPFYIDQYEVTNAQYSACVAAGDCQTLDYSACNIYDPESGRWEMGGKGPGSLKGPQHPVVCVSWHQADAYCRWAGKRLPTEAQWEKAARGHKDDREFPWGQNWEPTWLNWGELAGFGKDDGFETSAPVGSFPKNVSPYGAYDMAGNVWEWTADWQDDAFYQHAPLKDPFNDLGGANRIVRGGSWSFAGNGARVAYRYFEQPEARDDALGFRCVQKP